jgi:hypothetical protein
MEFTSLHPPPLGARSCNHASHSREMMRTTFGAFRHAVTRCSSSAMRVSAYAARSAFLIVVGLTCDAGQWIPLGQIQGL